MLKRILFIILFFTLSSELFSQISEVDSICVGETIQLTNPSGVDNPIWDFCEGRMASLPQISTATGVYSKTRNLTIFQKGTSELTIQVSGNAVHVGQWNDDFSVVLNYNSYPVDPTMIRDPWDIEVITDENIVFVGNNGSNNVGRIRFDGGFLSSPTLIDTIPNITFLSRPVAISPFQINENKYLLVATATGLFYLVNFADSYLNEPVPEAVKVLGGIPGAYHVELIEHQNRTIGVLTTSSGIIYRIEINSSLNVEFNLINLGFPSTQSISRVAVEIERGMLIITSPQYGNYNYQQIGLSLSTFNVLERRYYQSVVPEDRLSAFDLLKLNGYSVALGADLNTGKFHRFKFSTLCKTDLNTSEALSPTVQIQNSGKLYFSVTDQNTGQYRADSIFVRSPIVANFSSNFNCFGASTQFNDQSDTPGTQRASVLWNFGDPASGAANTSTSFTPSHAFSAAGLYTVNYTITDECGFVSQSQKQVRIYPENDASPNFNIQQAIKCSFDSLQFQDQSTFVNDEIISWAWNFGDGNTSQLRNPRHAYQFEGSYLVRLDIGLSSGCVRSITKTENIISGTRLGFDVYKNCEGAVVVFDDTSVMPGGITEVSRLWNFGDPASGANNTSSNTNPNHTFSGIGVYLVQLQVENSLGCVNTLTQRVEVFANPVITITPPTALSERAFRFRTDEIITNSPVTEYLWTFGHNSASSILKEPLYTYPSTGTYEASLFVRTIDGCEALVNFNVNVLPGLVNQNFPRLQFQAADTIDAGESISITNSSTNFTQFSWDFNEGDLRQAPQNHEIVLANSVPFRQVRDLKMIKEGAIWYALTVTNDSRFRVFKFANGLELAPTVFDYGNPSGLLLNAWGLDVLNENGKWRGLIANNGLNTGLVYFSFENGLEQAPQAKKIDYTFPNTRLANVAIRKFQGDLYAFVLGNAGRLEILNFGGKLFDGLQVGAVHRSIPIVSGGYSFDILIKDNLIFGSYILTNGRQHIFRIGSDFTLQSTDVFTRLSNVTSLGSGRLAFDAGEIVHIFSDYNTGRIHRLTIPEDLVLAKVKYQVLSESTGIGFFANLTLFQEGSQWRGFGLNFTQGNLFRLTFPAPADINPLISTAYEPTVQFNEPGTFYYTLRAVDHLGHTSYLTDSIRVRRPPVVSFSSDFNCSYFDTFFNSEIITDGTQVASYAWDFGDPDSDTNTSTEANPIHRFSSAGIYTITLTVVDDRGATGSRTQELRIYPEDAFTADFSFDEVACSNSPVFFNNLSIGLEEEIREYFWDFGDPTSGAANTSLGIAPFHTYETSGSFVVNLTVTGISGCQVSISKVIEVNEAPAIDFTFNTVCQGNFTTFNLVEIPAGLVSLDWDFGDSNFSELESPSHRYQQSGFYTVQLLANYENGCTFSRSKVVFVPSNPQVDFTSEIACAGTNIAFTDISTSEGANIVSRRWHFGNQIITSTEAQTSFTFAQSGTYPVKLVVTNTNGCRDSLTRNITVRPMALADFSWNRACAGELISFTDDSQGGAAGTITNRIWRIGANTYSGAEAFHTFNTPGTYSVILEVSTSNNCTQSVTKSISINPSPQADFQIVQSCEGQELIVQNSSTSVEPIAQYQWTLLGSTQTRTGAVVGFNSTDPGTYQIQLTITTQNGCLASITKSVQVFPLPSPNFSFTPEFGAPPLQVNFTNSSQGAANYLWDFGDGNTATNNNAVHTYEQTGVYTVRLTATSANACQEQTERIIRVVDPVLDLEMNSIRSNEQGENIQLIADMSNRGTVTIRTIDLTILLSSGARISEQISVELVPGARINHALQFQLKKGSTNAVDFVCVRAMPSLAGLIESTSGDNEVCLSLGQRFDVLAPNPNPAKNLLIVPVILPSRSPIEISLQNAAGHTVFQQIINTTTQGLNTIEINTENYGRGIYLLRVKYQNSFKNFKVVLE